MQPTHPLPPGVLINKVAQITPGHRDVAGQRVALSNRALGVLVVCFLLVVLIGGVVVVSRFLAISAPAGPAVLAPAGGLLVPTGTW